MGSIDDDTRWLDATDQAALVSSGQVSARELVQAALERIDRHDGPINSVVVRWSDDALSESDAVAPSPTAPFAGVPTLLKDLNAHRAGQVLTNANVGLREAQPVSAFDSTVVARLRAAGTIDLGRTASSEVGTLPVTETAAYGPTRNPWSLEHTPGGSSGGAAAAVAAGLVPVAHASDGGGSIRIPAACCGLVGLKPSQGRISMGPDRQESGLSVDFVVTRSVRDTAAFLDAIAGPAVGDNVVAPAPRRSYVAELGADPGRLRIGVLDHRPDGTAVHPDCSAAVAETARVLEGLGHHVDVGFPDGLHDPSLVGHFFVLWAVSRSAALAGYERTLGRPLGPDEVEPTNRALAEFAGAVTATAYAEGLAAVAQLRRRILGWWADGFDLLLTPTVAAPPLAIGALDPPPDNPLQAMADSGEWVAFTPPFNTTGQPAISLPLAWSAEGLPIGVQLVADYGREDLLIAVAAQLELAQPWAHRRPPG